jgi:hypothetical protein
MEARTNVDIRSTFGLTRLRRLCCSNFLEFTVKSSGLDSVMRILLIKVKTTRRGHESDQFPNQGRNAESPQTSLQMPSAPPSF